MDLHDNWSEIKSLFYDSFKSSFHYTIATVAKNGDPHVTPIGSLILGKPGQGFYFERFPQNLPRNISQNNRVCVLAVNSSRLSWLTSLVDGKFGFSPAVRLYGIAKEMRPASDRERALWQKRVSSVRFTKGTS